LISSIFLILIIFSILFIVAWIWFFGVNSSKSINGIYNRALKKMEKEKYKEAKDLFIIVEAQDSNYKELQKYLGICYVKLENYEKAKDYFEKLIKTASKDFLVLQNAATVFFNLKDFQRAEEFYKKALEINKANADCFMNLGISQFCQNKYQDAIESLKDYEFKFGANVKTQFYINRCEESICDENDKQKMSEILNEYVRLSKLPEFPREFDNVLAVFFAKMGKIDLMLESCNKIISYNPEDTNAYKLLGLVNVFMKKPAQAKNDLSIALDLDPENEEVKEILSFILCQEEKHMQSKECREKVRN